MTKNYFLRLLQTSLMCCLAFTLTNCGNIDNPLEELPTTPSDPKLATPLTMEALTAGTIVVSNPKSGMQYSLNGGTKTAVSGDITVAIGDKVAFYGNGTSISKYSGTEIAGGTAEVKVYGNIMSLIDEKGFANNKTIPSETQVFPYLFLGNAKLKDASGLLLPATTLYRKCYEGMFRDCSSLTNVPELPATTLAEYCYAAMFMGCTSLTTAPELPATTLAASCYEAMFSGCSSLTTAPELPVTTLADRCYYSMFNGCTSMTTAPELPATTLTAGCYEGMFRDCSSLTTAPELPATKLTNYCYYTMFFGCSKLSSVTCLATDISATDCTKGWLTNAGLDASVTTRTLHIKTGQNTSDARWNLSSSGDENTELWTAVADK